MLVKRMEGEAHSQHACRHTHVVQTLSPNLVQKALLGLKRGTFLNAGYDLLDDHGKLHSPGTPRTKPNLILKTS